MWGVVPRAWGPDRTQHRGVTSARAASSLTGIVAQILLERAWWVAWDPRGPIPILELGECIPMGSRFTPYLSHIPLSCLWTQENELSCPQHRPGPVDIRILEVRRPGIAALFRPEKEQVRSVQQFQMKLIFNDCL